MCCNQAYSQTKKAIKRASGSLGKISKRKTRQHRGLHVIGGGVGGLGFTEEILNGKLHFLSSAHDISSSDTSSLLLSVSMELLSVLKLSGELM